jgi:thioredoxin reductase
METSMMTDPNLYLTMAGAGLAGLGMVCMAALAGWRGWLALKEREIGAYVDHASHDGPTLPNASARIEIADLKERIRKLEAIASGVDL